MDGDELLRRFYPEIAVGGFTHVDATVGFYNQIAAIIRPTDKLLDFGAGRGASSQDDGVSYRRQLGEFKGRCRHVEGCDVDPVILENASLDHAEVVHPGDKLPYRNDEFDLIVARFVFEHIEDPEFTARELLRVLKHGGVIAATTPNKWGYIAVCARAVPERLYLRVLSRSQPLRKSEDVFPTFYRLNTPSALRKAFGSDAEIVVVPKASEPSYHFGWLPVFRFLRWLNKHAPQKLLPTLDVFIRKP